MEEKLENRQPEEQPEGYVPRPAWQVWCARIALVVFILLVIMQLIHMVRGGLS